MMKGLLFIVLLLSITMTSYSQTSTEIIANYEKYVEPTIKDRRFKHSEIEPLISRLGSTKGFTVIKEGESIEGRAIYSVSWGKGPTNVLLWSQMHGDEPTATMAIFDFFNFLTSDGNEAFKKTMAENLTLTFLPMLNPDGAERHTRRNALGVDLNRDAVRLQSPEAKILKAKRDETDADFGFNLHDQGRVYAAGNNPKQATISFLAPAFNHEKDVNEVRENAMKLISQLVQTLNGHIPGHIAKYSDEFEPRAFGDNIQKWGTSLILIESGGYPEDREKQVIRKMNFIALLTSFESISSKSYLNATIDQYESLPFNERLYFDVLIRNVTITNDGKEYVVDIAINHDEISTAADRDYYLRGVIAEIGDLSIYYGYKTIDATGMRADPGTKSRSTEMANSSQLLNSGTLFIELGSSEKKLFNTPLNIVGVNGAPTMEFKIGNLANFVIRKDGKIRYLIMNGFVVDPKTSNPDVYGLDLR